MPKSFLTVSALFCSIIQLFVGDCVAAPQREKVNVILIMADDLGYETLGANGGQSYATPFLDRFASEGVRFEHCYSQPLCTPSRVQIMTGKYNVRNYRKFGVLPRTETTFAHLLKEAGYATCVAGKWQLGAQPDSPQHFGFDQALLWQHTRSRRREGSDHDTRFENPRLELNGESRDYDDGEYAPDLMVDFISDFVDQNQEKPFFIYYPMILTHCPFVPTPDSADWDRKSLGSPNYKGSPKYFGDMVIYMDKLVGRIAEVVTEKGLAENTLILFTGDNGTDRPIVSSANGREVAGAKGSTTDAGTRVPLIVWGPSWVKPAVSHDLIDFSDFLPTLCDIAGIAVPSEIDGRSFLPQLRGEAGNPREYVYCWYSSNGSDKRARVFARTQEYKLYHNGELFKLPEDLDEKNPLKESELTEQQRDVREKLQAVIDSYGELRGK